MASGIGNDLLAELPSEDRERVLRLCEYISLVQDQTLGEPDATIHHVYFPVDSFISLLTREDRRDALAVGLVGSEGMLGASLALGVRTSPLRARVEGAGTALRMRAEDFQQAIADSPQLDLRVRGSVYVLLDQVAQTASCAAFHVVEARLACWLLMAHDRAHADRFMLTHDRIARMLGVRRSGVSTAAGLLQSRRVIRYTRGHIAILDRRGLEQSACGCYRSMRNTMTGVIAAAANDAHEGVRTGVPPARRTGAARESVVRLRTHRDAPPAPARVRGTTRSGH